MRSIASKIDTGQLVPEIQDARETISEGAGVGFGIEGFRISQSERGTVSYTHLFSGGLEKGYP